MTHALTHILYVRAVLNRCTVIRQSLLNYLQVIKSKGGKESETEYFAALVSAFS